MAAPRPAQLSTGLRAVSSPELLQAGWDRVRVNQGGPGGDGMTIEQFGRNSASRLIGLSRKLREGTYRPGPARRVYIPKKSGGLRPLDIPCVADRIVQASTALHILPTLEAEFEDESFGYRPGRGVLDAVRRILRHRRDGYRWVVDADIRRYFESVPHDVLVPRLEAVLEDDGLVDLIWTWLEWYCPQGRGLPQGSPISPALANLFLDDMDERIAGRGVRLVRYADDFVLLTKSEDRAEAALETAGKLLAENGLELHPEKTRITSFEQGFRFLGHIFVRSLAFRETAIDETPEEETMLAMQAAIARDEKAEAERLAAFKADPEGSITGAERQDLGLSRRWRTLYVLEPRRRLSAAGEAFTVMEGERRLVGIPAGRLGRVEVGFGCDIDAAALDLASAHGVPLVRVDGHGRPAGYWMAPANSHADRHAGQFELFADFERRLEAARAIVAARVFNQKAFLKRLDRTVRHADMAETAVKLNRVLRRLPHEEDINSLLGREGEAGALFWPMLSKLMPDGWRFPKRRLHPASGIAEVALNVTADLLERDVLTAILRSDLHPGIGVLHAPRDLNHALVFDLMEEFRSPIAEAVVTGAIGRGQIRAAMFVRSNERGWRIGREGYRALIRAYETHVNRTIRDPSDGERMTWRGLMLRQARRFAACCETGTHYRPYRMDY